MEGRATPARISDVPSGSSSSNNMADTGGMNPRYTFETFVKGASNQFALAAALRVAETPGRSYNPLFIYGSAGLGKTHLLHAIGHYVHNHYQHDVVRYVSTETFLNEYVDAIRTNTTANFKRRYRDIDVLLIDDIQFMEGKEGLQEEFFHTFNGRAVAAPHTHLEMLVRGHPRLLPDVRRHLGRQRRAPLAAPLRMSSLCANSWIARFMPAVVQSELARRRPTTAPPGRPHDSPAIGSSFRCTTPASSSHSQPGTNSSG